MFYTIRHLTRFRYDSPVSESLMEVRMHPRTEGFQRCLSFQLSVDPRARVNVYRDYLGNSVHHFDVPGEAYGAGDSGGVAGGDGDAAGTAGRSGIRTPGTSWTRWLRPAIIGRC